MTNSIEICKICPLKPEELHGGEQRCSALGGSVDYAVFATNCLAVTELNKLGKDPGTFSELLKLFPLLKNINLDENNNPQI